MVKKYLLIFLIFVLNSFLLSCQDNKGEDPQEILKVILVKYEVSCLNEKMWVATDNDPKELINSYYNWIYTRPANSLLVKNIIDVIPKEEIIQMRDNYTHAWSGGKWKPEGIFSVTASFSECEDKKRINISEPLFSADFKKALVYVKLENCNGSSSEISVLQKINNNWQYSGSVPMSIGDRLDYSNCN